MCSDNNPDISFKNEVSSTLDEEPLSFFEEPDAYNSVEETADEQQVACKGLERFCLDRDSQSLNSGEPSLEELVVRSNSSILELMRKRDTSEFNPGLASLPLSAFKPHQEDRMLDHTPTYIKNQTTQGMEIQSLNTTILPYRLARKQLLLSESRNPSNHSLPQVLDDCAATLQLQNDHRIEGMSKAQRKKTIYTCSANHALEIQRRGCSLRVQMQSIII